MALAHFPVLNSSLDAACENITYKVHFMTFSVARLARNVDVMGSSPIKGPRCFLEQQTLPLLLSTGWFQERA